jgi:hypothetical protein
MITVTLTIPDDVYSALKTVSEQRAISLDETATEALRRGMPPIALELPDDSVDWDTLPRDDAVKVWRAALGYPEVQWDGDEFLRKLGVPPMTDEEIEEALREIEELDLPSFSDLIIQMREEERY